MKMLWHIGVPIYLCIWGIGIGTQEPGSGQSILLLISAILFGYVNSRSADQLHNKEK